MNHSTLFDSYIASIIAPFKTEQGINKRLLLIFIFINGFVLLNAILHAPNANYDGIEHSLYFETLAEKNRLPNFEESKEYFSPPLPYLLPAAILHVTSSSSWGAAKMGQFLNVILSLGVTFTLLKICDQLSAEDQDLKVFTLGMLSLMPVYYKTFSLVRGEPFVTLFAILVVYLALIIFSREILPESIPISKRQRNIQVLLMGVCLGLVILSRQWGAFLFPALAVFVALLKLKTTWSHWRTIFSMILISFMTAIAVGGWFYLSLLGRYGTITAFNRNPNANFSFSNQPAEFYFGLGLNKIFTQPVRDSFANQFIPIFYSEFWGDYWGYFIFGGRDTRSNELLVGSFQQLSSASDQHPEWYVTNKFDIAPYLGRVNLISLLPSGIMLLAIGFGFLNLKRFISQIPSPILIGNTLFILILLATATGYAWFLIRYPNPEKGDTIKASYMLHLYPYIALLSGQVVQKIKSISPLVSRILIILLLVVFLHNLPVMLTHFIPWNLLAYYPPFRWITAYLPWY